MKLAIVVALGLLCVATAARADGSVRLSIATETGAHVAIDGEPAGTSAIVNAGRHVVVVTRRGRVPVAKVVDLAFGERRTLDIELAPTDQRLVVPWLAGAAGVLAMGTIAWSAFAATAADSASRIEATRETTGITATQLATYQRAIAHRDRDATLAWGTGLAALALGGTALGLYWFDERTAIVLRPTGATVVGRF